MLAKQPGSLYFSRRRYSTKLLPGRVLPGLHGRVLVCELQPRLLQRRQRGDGVRPSARRVVRPVGGRQRRAAVPGRLVLQPDRAAVVCVLLGWQLRREHGLDRVRRQPRRQVRVLQRRDVGAALPVGLFPGLDGHVFLHDLPGRDVCGPFRCWVVPARALGRLCVLERRLCSRAVPEGHLPGLHWPVGVPVVLGGLL
jgi:hypothetical protein